jgi:hypothetical protein
MQIQSGRTVPLRKRRSTHFGLQEPQDSYSRMIVSQNKHLYCKCILCLRSTLELSSSTASNVIGSAIICLRFLPVEGQLAVTGAPADVLRKWRKKIFVVCVVVKIRNIVLSDKVMGKAFGQ